VHPPEESRRAAREQQRCAVHPGRPAVDHCPTCGRPRCGADAANLGPVCGGCQDARPAEETSGDRHRGRVAAGVLVAMALGAVGGWIGTEYIGATGFAEIVPFLIGLLCASGAAAAAGTHGRGSVDLGMRVVGAVSAVLGTALGYKLQPGGGSALHPAHTVLPAYAAAAAGAAVSRLLR
jgi:hypothetical protein